MRNKNLPIIENNSRLSDCLKIIDNAGFGCCLLVDEASRLVGVLTDGDLRRALISGADLTDSAYRYASKNFHYAVVDDDISAKFSKLNDRVRVLPILDQKSRVIDLITASTTNSIPICEPVLDGNEVQYVMDCMTTNWISSQGKFVRRLEEQFSELHAGLHAVAVSNGTVALHLALLALGVTRSDEVIVPSLTFAATVNAVNYCGANVSFCEVGNNLCIDPNEIISLLNENTRYIIPVHLYGRVANLEEISIILKERKIKIIEDCAEAIGSQYKGQPVGIFGDAATFSFFGNKTITTGEGGMVLFKDAEVADRARILRDHGMSSSKRYWHEVVGYNYRMTNIQAAIGVAQIERLEEKISKKRMIARAYQKYLKSSEHIVYLPTEDTNELNSYWLYTVLLHEKIDRDLLLKEMKLKGIDTRPIFYPLHSMPPYQHCKTSKTMTKTERFSKAGISLPSSLNLTENDIEFIAKTLIAICDKQA